MNNNLDSFAENGEWQERAFEFLHNHTKACMDIIYAFVFQHWQIDESDEENLCNFEFYESEFDLAFAE